MFHVPDQVWGNIILCRALEHYRKNGNETLRWVWKPIIAFPCYIEKKSDSFSCLNSSNSSLRMKS